VQASFTAEEASERDRGKAIGGEIEEAKSRRLQELESLLGEFKAKNDALVKELDALGGASARLQGRSWDDLFDDFDHELASKVELQQGLIFILPFHSTYLKHLCIALEEAKAESLTQSEKIEELEQKLFDLGGDIAAGQHVPPGVRVLSLKDNPEQAWVDLRQSAMDRLRGENEALLKRLKELEALAASAGVSGATSAADDKELVPRESWELAVREKKELEELVVQKEKRLERLQMVCRSCFRALNFDQKHFVVLQIFTSKGEEFREAIASILGLKLAFYPNGQVRVTSVFDLNAAFIFQQPLPGKEHGSTARVQLVATGNALSQELPQLMRSWIEEEQCIPGFLASVTMECYDKAKREGTLPQAVA
jgi:mitotic spindle assembly checkpoint protein MAD1